MKRQIIIAVTLLSSCIYANNIESLYQINGEKSQGYSRVHGIAIDPKDQSIYAWAEGHGTIPECNRQISTTTEVYLIKFNPSASGVIWCRSYNNVNAVANKTIVNNENTSNNGPVVDPRSGDIFVYGCYRSVLFADGEGLFLLRYSRDGDLIAVLQDDYNTGGTKTAEAPSGLFLDAERGLLYAGSTNRTRLKKVSNSHLARFNITSGNQLLQKSSMKFIWNRYAPDFQPKLLSIHVYNNIIYGTGSDDNTEAPFLVAAWASNFTLLPQFQQAIGLLGLNKGIGFALAIDPFTESLYVGGTYNTLNQGFTAERTLWRLSLNDLTVREIKRSGGDQNVNDSYIFLTFHTASQRLIAGVCSFENQLELEIYQNLPEMKLFSTAKYNIDGGDKATSYGYMAAVNSDNQVIIGGALADTGSLSYQAMGIFKFMLTSNFSTSTTATSTSTKRSGSSVQSRAKTFTATNTPQPLGPSMSATSIGIIASICGLVLCSIAFAVYQIAVGRTTTRIDDKGMKPSGVIVNSAPRQEPRSFFIRSLGYPQRSRLNSEYQSAANTRKTKEYVDTVQTQRNSLNFEPIRRTDSGIIPYLSIFGSKHNFMSNPKARSIQTTKYQPEECLSTVKLDSTKYQTDECVSTVQLDTTQYQTQAKELAIPGPYLIENSGNAFIVLSVLAKTANSALMTATAVSQDIIDRSGGQTLAVKTISINRSQQLQSFYLELSIMYLFRNNDRFVEFLGFTVQPYFSILTVFYPNGSLDKFLYCKKRKVECTKHMILTFATQISDAVRVLHNNGFAHCDLKPHNVLVDTCSNDPPVGFRCRLGDFGLTKQLDDRHAKVQAFDFPAQTGLTLIYAAPESIYQFRQYWSTYHPPDYYRRADIYSLALMLYELSVCRLAWH